LNIAISVVLTVLNILVILNIASPVTLNIFLSIASSVTLNILNNLVMLNIATSVI